MTEGSGHVALTVMAVNKLRKMYYYACRVHVNKTYNLVGRHTVYHMVAVRLQNIWCNIRDMKLGEYFLTDSVPHSITYND